MSDNIEGPVQTGRVPLGTWVQLQVPARTMLVASGVTCFYSGYFFLQTLKAVAKVTKETPTQ